MTTLYPNSRLAALPCERMRGCIFAEDFVNETTTQANKGLASASAVFDHGVVLPGDAQVSYGSWNGYTTTDYLSIVLRFSATAQATSKKLLISTGHWLSDGFQISADADGINANHNDGGVEPTACSVDLSYGDGNTHTITYLVDLVSGFHHLYVDSLAVNTQATTKVSIINASGFVYFSSTIGGAFTGTIYKARIFNQLLTEDEHDLYHTDALTSFLDMPTAVYRCDAFGDDTDSNTIHDRTTNHNDLYKGDRATSAGFPTFSDGKYLFDMVDDYISNFVTLPTDYTITAVSSTPQLPYPRIQQHNDTTFSLPLTVAGQYWGYLHSLIIHSKTLTQIERYHDEYMQQCRGWKGRLWGAYRSLEAEGVCVFAEFMDADHNVFLDYAGEEQGIANGVTRDDSDGCSFAAHDGNVTFDDRSGLRLSEGTIAVFGDLTPVANGNLLDKGAGYNFNYTTAVIRMHSSFYSYPLSGDEHVAVTFKDGMKPQFFVNGIYVGDGNSTSSIDDTASDDLVVGNNNGLSNQCEFPLKQVAIFNTVLTEREIKALYESAKVIGATAMEAGNRIRVREVDTGTAIAETVDPGGPFQLIDITVIFDSAPTTSEDIVITSVNSDSDVVEEHSFDPSTSALTSHVFRFDKRFPDGTTLAVAYTNTDARTIQTNTVYQLDQSVV